VVCDNHKEHKESGNKFREQLVGGRKEDWTLVVDHDSGLETGKGLYQGIN